MLWDFGGVILSSPFEAFNRYETEVGLPKDFIRGLNARNGDTNAWAKMERSEVSLEGFVELFEEEARQQGHNVDGWRILQSLSGDIRPQMVEALRRCSRAFRVACITNNMKHGEGPGMARSADKAKAVAEIMTLFEHVVESSKLGLRKPDPRIYRHACDLLGVQPERLHLSRRSRHQPEACPRARHAHHQGRRSRRRDRRAAGDGRHSRCEADEREARPARPITAKYLQNAATFYLERYPASSAEGLRRVLGRRVRKAEMADAPVMENVEQAIEAIVAKFVDGRRHQRQGVRPDQGARPASARHVEPADAPEAAGMPASTAIRSTARWRRWTRSSTPTRRKP